MARQRCPRFEPEAILLEACARGDVDEVQQTIDQARRQGRRHQLLGASRTASGKTPLHVAVEHGHLQVVRRLLLEKDIIDVNAVDDYGWTPLAFGVAFDDCRLAKALLQHGADLEGPHPPAPSMADDNAHCALDLVGSEQMSHLLERHLHGKYHGKDVTALYDFDPKSDLSQRVGDELPICRGQVLNVLSRSTGSDVSDQSDGGSWWWLVKDARGQRGYVPRTHVQ